MVNRIRLFLGLKAAVFIAAALIHFGVVLDGYNDPGSRHGGECHCDRSFGRSADQSVAPQLDRRAGILVQGLALVGTLVSLTFLVILGPRTFFDIAIHVAMVVLLVSGLVVTVCATATFQGMSHRVTDTANRR